ncbi:thymidine phosphorylase [Halobacteriovorax sp. GB3]|uniref:thymidine phosphorylase n=1 Tax=Halobacteriovorax sp. GB3 TaxID=2719615 RepID=UPI002361DCA1|nr:thymidine phosphorylase [Halobacteriovorax sp. GB3]MDD0853872.1 thymidine phosphorylase [Halobacteriovorax sp. GB3]
MKPKRNNTMTKKKVAVKKTQADQNPMRFTASGIISKKRDGKKLTNDEIRWFIDGLTSGQIADYQMTALLMAIFINGLDKKETAYLTDAMLYSGDVVEFEGRDVIDKHSTGGVGDKASFILAPIAAACGVKVPMIAGRGLGHTGGTVDKIESVKGFKTELPLKKFKEMVEKEGLSLIGQTKTIAPADKKIYALRDVTGTVESIPLITASIMSKKLAEGASGLVMDIKTGSGAFMSTLPKARALAKSLRDTASRFDKSMMTMITDMNQPLGLAIGNSLEIVESIETLRGKGPKDLTEISVQLAGGMIYLAGKAKSHKAGIAKAKKSIKDGSALKVFKDMIKNQGGDELVVDDYSRLPMAKEVYEVKAQKAGYISQVNCKALGLHCVSLGGGRMKASDKIDFGVGLVLTKKIGDKVKKGETLLKVYHNKSQLKLVEQIDVAINKSDIKLSATKPKTTKPLVYEIKEN